ncbi:MAG: thiamine pyrophosphate-binding protein, partial [Betaproteobacteria bacterium]
MNTVNEVVNTSFKSNEQLEPNPAPSSAQIIGAEILVRALAEEGVEYVWGYPGGSVLYIYDEIHKQEKFEHILVRHEQGAV